MNLYLDDDSTSQDLVRRLRNAGHNVEFPIDVGLVGREDPVHLTYAIDVARVLLTMNHDDFQDLHHLVIHAQGHHPGIIVVRKDNDRRRDLSPSGIVLAIANLEASGVPLADTLFILNQWK